MSVSICALTMEYISFNSNTKNTCVCPYAQTYTMATAKANFIGFFSIYLLELLINVSTSLKQHEYLHNYATTKSYDSNHLFRIQSLMYQTHYKLHNNNTMKDNCPSNIPSLTCQVSKHTWAQTCGMCTHTNTHLHSHKPNSFHTPAQKGCRCFFP